MKMHFKCRVDFPLYKKPIERTSMLESEIFNVLEKSKTVYMTIPSFDRTGLVNHGLSTKKGGISKGYYSEMNLGFYVGDDTHAVKKNYDIFCECLTIEPSTMVMMHQMHNTNIYMATRTNCGDG